MFGILLSALNAITAFVLQKVVMKFVIFAALLAVVVGFIPFVVQLLPTTTALSQAFAAIPNWIWYWLQPFKLSFGIPLVLSAYATRFIIRRIPVIG